MAEVICNYYWITSALYYQLLKSVVNFSGKHDAGLLAIYLNGLPPSL